MTAPATTLRSGDRLGEYVLENRIGHGGFGEVWKARHHLWEETYAAVKVPVDPEFLSQLRNEAILQHRLDHPGIVRTLGVDLAYQPPYVVAEYVPGKSLRQILNEEGRLDLERAEKIFRQVLEALDHAHRRGVIHYDVKPGNILVSDGGQAKLTDFGLGRAARATHSLQLSGSLSGGGGGGSIQGTLNYLSPEQKAFDQSKGRPVDHRTDLYSAGIVLFEMLTGDIPHGGEVPSNLVADLPPWCDQIFRGLYARLRRRYASATEVLEDLGRLQGVQTVETSEEAPQVAASDAPPSPGLRPDAQGALQDAEAQPVLTFPLAVARPGGLVRRGIAFFLDAIVGAYFLFLVFFLLRALPILPVVYIRPSPGLFPLLLFLLYFAVPTVLYGRTVGKYVLGLRVVDCETGENPGFLATSVRTLFLPLSVSFFFLGILMAVFSSRRLTFHDIISGTRVIRDP